MKSIILENIDEVEFVVLAINSHAKGYKLCWEINNKFRINFIKKDYYKPEEMKGLEFSRFSYYNNDAETQMDLLANYSRNGFLLPQYKTIDYFLKIQNPFWKKEKQEFIAKLNQIAEILLIFELDLNNINLLNPFIFCDKEN